MNLSCLSASKPLNYNGEVLTLNKPHQKFNPCQNIQWFAAFTDFFVNFLHLIFKHTYIWVSMF